MSQSEMAAQNVDGSQRTILAAKTMFYELYKIYL